MALGAARTVYEILEGGQVRGAVVFQSFIVSLVILNVISVMLETEDGIRAEYGVYLGWFESVSLSIFACEYALRIALYRLRGDARRFALARFVVSPMMLVDLVVIIPLFAPFLIEDTRVVRVLRLLKIFAIFKMYSMADSMIKFSSVLKSRIADLVLSFFILFLVLILASSMMYYAEREAQPEVFSSIPASMWWGIVTLATIGYGDMVPVTTLGRIIGAGVVVLGIALYAIPTGIIVAAFNERRKRDDSGSCPHCGKNIV